MWLAAIYHIADKSGIIKCVGLHTARFIQRLIKHECQLKGLKSKARDASFFSADFNFSMWSTENRDRQFRET